MSMDDLHADLITLEWENSRLCDRIAELEAAIGAAQAATIDEHNRALAICERIFTEINSGDKYEGISPFTKGFACGVVSRIMDEIKVPREGTNEGTGTGEGRRGDLPSVDGGGGEDRPGRERANDE